MQDETSHKRALDAGSAEQAIMWMLLEADQQRPWAVSEIEREIGDRAATADALGALDRAGLIHRLDRFVFASRAALYADEIDI